MKRYFKISSSLFLAFVLFAVSVVNAQVSNFRLQFPKGKTAATQSRSIKAGNYHDIFFRAKKGQRITIEITSANGAAQFNLGAMNEFDVSPIQDNTTSFSGRLPFAGTGEYVIRVEAESNTRYTLNVSIK